MPIRISIDRMLVKRRMSVGDFAEAIGITPANVAVLKNGRAKAVRFSTLDAICRVLDCQPGDVLHYEDQLANDDSRATIPAAGRAQRAADGERWSDAAGLSS